MSEVKILPCLWCGSGRVQADDGVHYEYPACAWCLDCERGVITGSSHDTKDKAISAWNTLATLREERDRAVEAAYREGWETAANRAAQRTGLNLNEYWQTSEARKALGVDRDR